MKGFQLSLFSYEAVLDGICKYGLFRVFRREGLCIQYVAFPIYKGQNYGNGIIGTRCFCFCGGIHIRVRVCFCACLQCFGQGGAFLFCGYDIIYGKIIVQFVAFRI